MVKAVIVCGYGKRPTSNIICYVWSLLSDLATDFAAKKEPYRIIVSGGDTENHHKWKTEAHMMEYVIKLVMKKRGMPKNMMTIEAENSAYNTPTNILFSKRMLGDNFGYYTEIIIVCNEAHLAKTVFASFKIFGSKTMSKKVSFYTYPITNGFSQNIKTYLKTPFEVFGYFFRPAGKLLEYWQWCVRNGRNSRMSFCKFCETFTKSGELM